MKHVEYYTSLDSLDTYLITDLPIQCPRCQARTEFHDMKDGRQLHNCLSCAYVFVMEEE
jgi:hypothetical protein